VDERACLERFSALIERGKTILDVGCGDGLPVDAYLVEQGFAVNGIDQSVGLIERARKNAPEGFYEVKDLVGVRDGEYCVDGVVSFRAMLHIPHEKYRALLTTFASFIPNGEVRLVAMRSDEGGRARGDSDHAVASDKIGETVELVEDAGFLDYS
jgi:cyclopropane fatty-acyl-phospholipid synthase-like methyltransferase